MINTQESTGADTLRPLVYVREPITASWMEYFYDGECKVNKGRIEEYKPSWAFELIANRGFEYEKEHVEPSAVESAPADEDVEHPSDVGQEQTVEEKPKKATRSSRPRKPKGK